jgi:hypothetical protein
LECASALIAEAFEREIRWWDGVRRALASLLVFLDSRLLWARVWFIDAMAAGVWALQRRERNVALLRSMILGHWFEPGDEQPDSLGVAGAMEAVLGLIHTHLLRGEPEPLIELLGPLMGVLTAPCLDVASRAREVERGVQLACAIQAGDRWVPIGVEGLDAELGVALPAVLREPSARRAWECLLFLAEHPDASNREVARGIGVAHDSQISSLLSRLAGAGLSCKRSEGAGKRNAWRLTPRGEEVAHGEVRRG